MCQLLALIFFYTPLNLHAADQTGQYLVMGLGNSSCNSFLNEDEKGAAYYLSWLAGYMTTYNHLTEDTYSVLGESKSALELETWLRDYCALNGAETFESATRNLIRNLRLFRLKSKK
jgi:hypothetical protein